MRLGLIIIPLIILAIALSTGNYLILRIFILSLLLLLLSFVWSRLGRWGLAGKILKTGQRYFAGQPFDFEAIIENSDFLPKIFLKINLKTNLTRHDGPLIINLPPRGNHYWRGRACAAQRGRYQLGPLEAEVSDPFGFFRLRRSLDKGQEIVVYPESVDLPFFWAESQTASGNSRNSWLTTEAGSVIFGIREYVPGDSLNRIHWRSSAHAGKLIVKDFDIDLSEKVWLILDLSNELKISSDTGAAEEYAITIAASILKKCADTGRHVGLIAQSDEYYFFPPRAGHQNMWRIMDALAVIKAGGQVPLNRIIDRAEEHFSGNSMAIVITASTSLQVADAIIRTQKRGIPVVAIMLDASSFGAATSSQIIEARLQALGIPLYSVKKGQSLADALNSQGKNPLAKSGSGQFKGGK